MLCQCQICKIVTSAIHIHHISYSPEITIKICTNCHFTIHHPPEALKELECLSPTLKHYVLLNAERLEKERWMKEERERILFETMKENAEQEMSWRYAFQQGFQSYDTATVTTKEEIEKYIKDGYDIVSEINATVLLRKPKKCYLANLPTRRIE